ncbi:MAG: hypothetical protein IKW28_07315 [Lachnospiraceae bacterium]|nr:hypothetical protein [Lachnospiraceae bacterium]
MFKKELKGAFSVEASLLFPIIVLVIWFLVIMALYFYNMCAMYRISSAASIQGVNKKRESAEQIEEQAKEQLQEMTEKELLMMKEVAYKVKVDEKEMQVDLTGKMEVPIFALISDSLDLWEMRARAVRNRQDPVEFIRNIRKVERN